MKEPTQGSTRQYKIETGFSGIKSGVEFGDLEKPIIHSGVTCVVLVKRQTQAGVGTQRVGVIFMGD